MADKVCPILPLTGVNEVIYRGDFVRRLQTQLVAAYQQTGNPKFDPGPVDGEYGPQTAAALREFQRAYPVDTLPDLLLGLTGREYASCATYNLLGLKCTGVYPVVGVTGDETLVALILAAERSGVLSLRCQTQIEPIVPPNEPWAAYVLLGVAVLFVGYVAFASSK